MFKIYTIPHTLDSSIKQVQLLYHDKDILVYNTAVSIKKRITAIVGSSMDSDEEKEVLKLVNKLDDMCYGTNHRKKYF